MKPKTVGRTVGGHALQMRTELTHAGLVAGTKILTAEGETPVEFLLPGDGIITRNAGMVRLRAVETSRITAEAVAVSAGALGAGRPAQNVIMPACQQVLVRDWRAKVLHGATQAVMPIGCLIDEEFIMSLGTRPMTLVRLGFDAPYVVYADGLEVSVPALTQAAQAA